MTRKSERELERAVEDLRTAAGVDGDPMEIEIIDTVVATEWSADDDATDATGDPDVEPGDVVERRRTRIWRDEGGAWHSETIAPETTGEGDR